MRNSVGIGMIAMLGFAPSIGYPAEVRSLPHETRPSSSRDTSPPTASWEHCALHLMRSAGVRGVEERSLLRILRRHSPAHTADYMEHLMGIMYVESRFRPEVVSPRNAHGLMQVTEIAAEESSIRCGLRSLEGNTQMLLDPRTNISYGVCYLSMLYTEMSGDWTRILITYNGGYRQLALYDRGGSINNESANYVLQVQRVVGGCNHTEE